LRQNPRENERANPGFIRMTQPFSDIEAASAPVIEPVATVKSVTRSVPVAFSVTENP